MNTVSSTPASYIDPKLCASTKNLITAKKGEVIVTGSSIGMPGVALPMVWDGEEELITSQDCIHIKVDNEKLDPIYLAYYLKSHAFFIQKRKISYGSGIFHIYAKDIAKCVIPLPSLKIQQLIGSFLQQLENYSSDKTYGIEQELNLRKEQLNAYLSKLTQKHRNTAKLVKLEDVASYISDKVNTKELDVSNYISVENLLQDLAGKIDSPNVPEDQRVNAYQEQDILLGNINPYLHKIWFATYTGGCNQDVLIIRPHTPAILSKYLFFVLCAPEFWHYNDRFTRKGALTRGDKQQIMQYEFPLPSIEEQEKIISFLDKLYDLTFDSQAGLETMRKLRLQQLDYYLGQFFL